MRRFFATIPLGMEESRKIVCIKRDSMRLARLRSLGDRARIIGERTHEAALAFVGQKRKVAARKGGRGHIESRKSGSRLSQHAARPSVRILHIEDRVILTLLDHFGE